MNCWSDKRFRERGVTLLEMLAALAILSMATVMFAVMSDRVARRTETIRFAERLASDIRSARADAIATGERIDMTFHVEDSAYAIENAPFAFAPRDVRLEFTGAAEYFTASGAGVLRLYADGSTSGALIRIGSDREVDSIDVDWLTGSVRLTRERRQ